MDNLWENHKELIKNNKLILKSQQSFRSEKHVFTEKVNKIALSDNDNKRIQWIVSIEPYAYGRSKDLVCKKKRLTVTI